MPFLVKTGFTAVVVGIAILAWVFRDAIGLDTSPLLLFGLTLFTAVALWLFPEVKNNAVGR